MTSYKDGWYLFCANGKRRPIVLAVNIRVLSVKYRKSREVVATIPPGVLRKIKASLVRYSEREILPFASPNNNKGCLLRMTGFLVQRFDQFQISGRSFCAYVFSNLTKILEQVRLSDFFFN